MTFEQRPEEVKGHHNLGKTFQGAGFSFLMNALAVARTAEGKGGGTRSLLGCWLL